MVWRLLRLSGLIGGECPLGKARTGVAVWRRWPENNAPP
tara:strand:- start:50 stop:166 length:117 start_codon:yes stop_codon:yes gene_type:complete